MRGALPSATLDPEGARRAEGVDKNIFRFHLSLRMADGGVDILLINKFLSHTESTKDTDFFSLLCDACAGINAADARGIHRDLTITNANTAPAE